VSQWSTLIHGESCVVVQRTNAMGLRWEHDALRMFLLPRSLHTANRELRCHYHKTKHFCWWNVFNNMCV